MSVESGLTGYARGAPARVAFQRAEGTLDERGLSCPRDVALVTFDALPVSEIFRPHLTAIAQPAYDMGTPARVS